MFTIIIYDQYLNGLFVCLRFQSINIVDSVVQKIQQVVDH